MFGIYVLLSDMTCGDTLTDSVQNKKSEVKSKKKYKTEREQTRTSKKKLKVW